MFLEDFETFAPKQEFESGWSEDVDVTVAQKVLDVLVDADAVIQRDLEHLKRAHPAKLSQNKPGMLDVFENVKTNGDIERLVRIWNAISVERTRLNEVGNIPA